MSEYKPTKDDWSAILRALEYAADEMDYDLHETRNSDFYDPEEREEREERVAGWVRLCKLIAPLTMETSDAND
jgi:hypothetical protein